MPPTKSYVPTHVSPTTVCLTDLLQPPAKKIGGIYLGTLKKCLTSNHGNRGSILQDRQTLFPFIRSSKKKRSSLYPKATPTYPRSSAPLSEPKQQAQLSKRLEEGSNESLIAGKRVSAKHSASLQPIPHSPDLRLTLSSSPPLLLSSSCTRHPPPPPPRSRVPKCTKGVVEAVSVIKKINNTLIIMRSSLGPETACKREGRKKVSNRFWLVSVREMRQSSWGWSLSLSLEGRNPGIANGVESKCCHQKRETCSVSSR